MQKENAILFIDGNNLYHLLKDNGLNPSDIDLKKLVTEVCEFLGATPKKVVYYNSIPNIRDGQEQYFNHLKFLKKIEKTPLFEVKTRKLQSQSTKEILKKIHTKFDGSELCETCMPLAKTSLTNYMGRIQNKEKGIDVMIAIDMITHTIINKKCDVCTLISGDADFIPAMDLIKKNKIKVCSSAPVKGYSYDLRKRHPFFILDNNFLKSKCLRDSLK